LGIVPSEWYQAAQGALAITIGIIDDSLHWNAFRHGLRDLGYLEGQNIAFDYAYGDGVPERLAEAAAALVRRRWTLFKSNTQHAPSVRACEGGRGGRRRCVSFIGSGSAAAYIRRAVAGRAALIAGVTIVSAAFVAAAFITAAAATIPKAPCARELPVLNPEPGLSVAECQ
jgi:hypothetical protein